MLGNHSAFSSVIQFVWSSRVRSAARASARASRGADAEVQAFAEGQVPARVRSVESRFVGISEDGGVAVCRTPEKHQVAAGGEPDAGQRRVLGDVAVVRPKRRFQPQGLLEHRR